MKKFEISLAAWSVHRMFLAGKLKQIDMPELCRKELDIGGLELVNSFFPSPQYRYCKQLRKRAEDHGVKILLIICDAEGDMAHAAWDQLATAHTTAGTFGFYLDMALSVVLSNIRGGGGDSLDTLSGQIDIVATAAQLAAAEAAIRGGDRDLADLATPGDVHTAVLPAQVLRPASREGTLLRVPESSAESVAMHLVDSNGDDVDLTPFDPIAFQVYSAAGAVRFERTTAAGHITVTEAAAGQFTLTLTAANLATPSRTDRWEVWGTSGGAQTCLARGPFEVVDTHGGV